MRAFDNNLTPRCIYLDIGDKEEQELVATPLGLAVTTTGVGVVDGTTKAPSVEDELGFAQANEDAEK